MQDKNIVSEDDWCIGISVKKQQRKYIYFVGDMYESIGLEIVARMEKEDGTVYEMDLPTNEYRFS